MEHYASYNCAMSSFASIQCHFVSERRIQIVCLVGNLSHLEVKSKIQVFLLNLQPGGFVQAPWPRHVIFSSRTI